MFGVQMYLVDVPSARQGDPDKSSIGKVYAGHGKGPINRISMFPFSERRVYIS